MPYSEKFKLYWFTPMRTASRSCFAIFRFFDFKDYGHEIKVHPNTENYEVVMNVRNPYSRLVSSYRLYCALRGIENNRFEDFLNEFCNCNNMVHNHQSFLEFYIKNNIPQGVKYIVKFENLKNDFLKVPFISENLENLKDIINTQIFQNNYEHEFIKFTKIDKRPWYEYYNQRIADYVYMNLEKQFELFNYNRNFWKDGTP